MAATATAAVVAATAATATATINGGGGSSNGGNGNGNGNGNEAARLLIASARTGLAETLASPSRDVRQFQPSAFLVVSHRD